jgi:hypothetical protein
MSDVSHHQDDDSLVIEPMQPLDGTAAPSADRTEPSRWWWKPQRLGMIALAEGLALLGLFWFAPWFSWQALYPAIGFLHLTPALWKQLRDLAALHYYSGWTVAQGISIPVGPGSTSNNTVFASLWLIPLTAVALLVVGGPGWQKRLSERQALTALLTLSALTLLGLLGFYLQAHNLQVTSGPTFGIGVSWGFWGAVGITAAAIDAAITLLKGARVDAHARRARWRTASAEA